MGMPKFFVGTPKNPRVEGEEQVKQKTSTSKIIGYTLLILIGAIVVGYVGFQVFVMFDRITQAIPEMMFAFEKPSIVKHVREPYQKAQQDFDAKFVTSSFK